MFIIPAAKTTNKPLRSSRDQILYRIDQILPFIKQIRIGDVQDSISAELEEEEKSSLCKISSGLDSVKRERQRHASTLSQESPF